MALQSSVQRSRPMPSGWKSITCTRCGRGATITPNAQRMEEYHLHEMWKSPNGTIRAILDGTVFRAPILVDGISPIVKSWKKPITIARHAYGDVYKATEMRVPKGKAELVFTDEAGNQTRQTIYEFECDGVLTGQYNKDTSIASFARSCFNYALATKQDLWFATKDTIAKKYDGTFKEIFQRIYEAEYQQKFQQAGLEYFYTLIDDAVARVIRSEGGLILAFKNYDGDVMLPGPVRWPSVRNWTICRSSVHLPKSSNGRALQPLRAVP